MLTKMTLIFQAKISQKGDKLSCRTLNPWFQEDVGQVFQAVQIIRKGHQNMVKTFMIQNRNTSIKLYNKSMQKKSPMGLKYLLPLAMLLKYFEKSLKQKIGSKHNRTKLYYILHLTSFFLLKRQIKRFRQ